MKLPKITLLILIFVVLVLGARAQEEQEKKSECCFQRRGFQGVCKITPAEDETCESILEYLNTAGTVGKTYCGGTKLRGGWKKVDCPKPNSSKD
jgi:hypothetical protein